MGSQGVGYEWATLLHTKKKLWPFIKRMVNKNVFYCPKLQCLFFILLFKLFFSFVFNSWRLITLQYCSGFCHTLTWISHGFTCVPHPDPPSHFSPSHPSRSSQCTSPEHLSHASNLGWCSVSPLIVYLFQCCSLRTSHPWLLPQSSKVCSVHLSPFLFCI